MRRIPLRALLSALLATNCALLSLGIYNGLRMRRVEHITNASKREIVDARDAMLSALVAEKAEELSRAAKTTPERVMGIARWVTAHIHNSEDPPNTGPLERYALRMGLCAARAQLFAQMLAYINVKAELFNIYNFGGAGGGHSAAQAYYLGKWHYFDVTYGGVFVRDGDVLSWDEIVADPQGAVQGMVVFEDTLDRVTNSGLSPRVDNRARMTAVYVPTAIAAARSYGFLGDDSVKRLVALVDLAAHPDGFVLGAIDDSAADVDRDGIHARLSENLGTALGNHVDRFEVEWVLDPCVPGAEYVLRYDLVGGGGPARVHVRASGAEVTEGALLDSDGSAAETWDVRLRCVAARASVVIAPEPATEQRVVRVDRLAFTRLGANTL